MDEPNVRVPGDADDATPLEVSMGGMEIAPPRPSTGGDQATTETARQLDVVLANIAEGVNIIDSKGRVVLVNAGFMRLYGFPPELASPGTPIAAFVRDRLERTTSSGEDVEPLVAARVRALPDALPGRSRRSWPTAGWSRSEGSAFLTGCWYPPTTTSLSRSGASSGWLCWRRRSSSRTTRSSWPTSSSG